MFLRRLNGREHFRLYLSPLDEELYMKKSENVQISTLNYLNFSF